jgi:hypothetical protein
MTEQTWQERIQEHIDSYMGGNPCWTCVYDYLCCRDRGKHKNSSAGHVINEATHLSSTAFAWGPTPCCEECEA